MTVLPMKITFTDYDAFTGKFSELLIKLAYANAQAMRQTPRTIRI